MHYSELLKLCSKYLMFDEYLYSLDFVRSIKNGLRDINVYGRLELTSKDEDPVIIHIPHVGGFQAITELKVRSAGKCARVSYYNTMYELCIHLYYNENNKLISCAGFNNDGMSVINIFIDDESITLFNVKFPKDQLDEIIFQNSLLQNEYSLEFLKEFV